MTDAQLASVAKFRMSHRDYGCVFWPGKVDLRDLDLDRVVHFAYRHLKVYPVDADLPPVGSGLNQLCRVTLFGVNSDQDAEHGFVDRLKQICVRQNTRFVAYRSARQEWEFDVSRW